jgi:hypothetical protein
MDNIPQVKGTGNSSTKNIESEVEKMDDFQHTAKFHLKFLNGLCPHYIACTHALRYFVSLTHSLSFVFIY